MSKPTRYLPLRKLLDPRPAEPAHNRQILDAVNIPYSELRQRVLELPSKSELILIADVGEAAVEAIQILQGMGRSCRLHDDFEFGDEPCPGRLWRPNEFVEANLTDRCGYALDLGCGSGRDSIYLASAGWQVDAVDRLPDALDRGRALAQRSLSNPSCIHFIQADLRKPFTFPKPHYDLVICLFIPKLPFLETLQTRIAPNGILLVEGFTKKHKQQFGKPRGEQFLNLEDLRHSLSSVARLEYAEDWHGSRHTGRLIARF